MTDKRDKATKATSPETNFEVLPRMLSISETAWYMGVSEKTVRNGIYRGADKPFPVKPKRHGKRVLFDIKDIDAYLDGLAHG